MNRRSVLSCHRTIIVGFPYEKKLEHLLTMWVNGWIVPQGGMSLVVGGPMGLST